MKILMKISYKVLVYAHLLVKFKLFLFDIVKEIFFLKEFSLKLFFFLLCCVIFIILLLQCIFFILQKSLKSHPELDGLTWAEKLEVLRSVNKKRDKRKTKQRKLKYVKADPNDPLYMWAFEQDQLYEQRRIKHLVEQARIKGGKHFDWVYEAQVKAQETDWDTTDKRSDRDVPGSGNSTDDDDDCDEGAAGDKNLGKYGINVPPKQVNRRLFNVHKVNRSKTYIAP
jgi:hypothetical protein